MSAESLVWQPLADAIVRDRFGALWKHQRTAWACLDGPGRLRWDHLVRLQGPLRLHRESPRGLTWERLPDGSHVARQRPLRLMPPEGPVRAVDEDGIGWEEPRGEWVLTTVTEVRGGTTYRATPSQWTWSDVCDYAQGGTSPVSWLTLADAKRDLARDHDWALADADPLLAAWGPGTVSLLAEHTERMVALAAEYTR